MDSELGLGVLGQECQAVLAAMPGLCVASACSPVLSLAARVYSDFSNGFLVAEIFSRYYDRDIQMHSFDNGNSTRVKRDNWAQLMKFFRKCNVTPGGDVVSDRTVEAIIHCRRGAVIEFLNQVYEFLSGRKYACVAGFCAAAGC